MNAQHTTAQHHHALYLEHLQRLFIDAAETAESIAARRRGRTCRKVKAEGASAFPYLVQGLGRLDPALDHDGGDKTTAEHETFLTQPSKMARLRSVIRDAAGGTYPADISLVLALDRMPLDDWREEDLVELAMWEELAVTVPVYTPPSSPRSVPSPPSPEPKRAGDATVAANPFLGQLSAVNASSLTKLFVADAPSCGKRKADAEPTTPTKRTPTKRGRPDGAVSQRS